MNHPESHDSNTNVTTDAAGQLNNGSSTNPNGSSNGDDVSSNRSSHRNMDGGTCAGRQATSNDELKSNHNNKQKEENTNEFDANNSKDDSETFPQHPKEYPDPYLEDHPPPPAMPAEPSPALVSLLDELRLIAVAGNYNIHEAVNYDKAKNILEATAGDVLIAAQLYWDDFLATLQQQHQNLDRRRHHHHHQAAVAEPPAEQHRLPDALHAAFHQRHAELLNHEIDKGGIRLPPNNNNNNNDIVFPPENDHHLDVDLNQRQRAIADHSDDDGDNMDVSGRQKQRQASLELRQQELRRRLFTGTKAEYEGRSGKQPHNFEQVLLKFEETMRKRAADKMNIDDPHDDSIAVNDNDVPVVGNDSLWQQQQRLHERDFQRYLLYCEESASVSDDEIVVRRRNNQYTSHRRLLQHLSRTCDQEQISIKRCKFNGPNNEELSDIDDADYLSDSDWIWDSLATMSSSTERSLLSSPTDILWGCVSSTSLKPAEEKVTDMQNGNDDTRTNNEFPIVDSPSMLKSNPAEKGLLPINQLSPAIEGNATSVLVASDDTCGRDDKEDRVRVNNSFAPIGIPRTWLNSGFHLVTTNATNSATDTTKIVGLALQPPNDDDLAYLSWKNQQADGDARHPTIPLPYHCRGITSVLSIVTGLMYTGVTVDNGGHMTCDSTRQPLQEFIVNENNKKVKEPKVKLTKGEEMYTQQSEADRLRREYDTRLTDALTALLLVAAETSTKRKENALRSLQSSKDAADQRKWQKIQRKLRLVPTCWWDTDIRLLSDTFKDSHVFDIPVATSYTNVEDLRTYVQANLRSFTSSGGCALFLETIIRIHGTGAITRMIRRARKAAGYSGAELSVPLIHCTCTARHYDKLDGDAALCQILKAQCKKGHSPDTTPTGHSCVSIELLSLLLVGRVHSTFQGWSSSPLGLGILSDKPGEIGMGLTRPEKPVWMLRGPTCYSVMWLYGCNDHSDTFSRIDRPGAVATLTHWNGWYHQRNATQLRLVTDRSKWKPVDTNLENENDDRAVDNEMKSQIPVVVQILTRRRRAKAIIANECTRVEIGNPDLMVSEEDTNRVTVHPDDPKFYPGSYRMWRYDMGEDPKLLAENEIQNRKQRGQVWKSFYSLDDREKHIVNTKLGPKICSILWTRWPRAIVDRFVPDDPPPVV